MSKSCLADLSHVLLLLQTKPIMHKRQHQTKNLQQHVGNNLNRVLQGLQKSSHALRFRDMVYLPTDIYVRAWGFPLSYLMTPHPPM